MRIRSRSLWPLLVLLALLAAGFHLGEAEDERTEMMPPVVYATGSQISVYYPVEKKLYVYTQMGGNCVHVYKLTTPGGVLERENCR